MYLLSFKKKCMKKCLISITLVFSLAFSVNAQKKYWEFGIQSGLNINSGRGTAIIKDKTGILTGFGVGAHFKLNLSPAFGIKAMLQYDQNGYAYNDLVFADNIGNTIGSSDLLIRLNYINIPVYAEFSTQGKIKITGGIGAFMGLLMSSNAITKVKVAPGYNNTTKMEYIKSSNFGITAGTGMRWKLNNKINLCLDLRDNLGLSNINKSINNAPTANIQINSFSLLFGVSVKM